MKTRGAGLAAALVALGGAVDTAPATARSTAATVNVRLIEFKVFPAVASVRAGRVTFVVRNAGRIAHDFVVLRTKLAPKRLPVVGARAKEVGLVGRTPTFGPGRTKRLTLVLKPGPYVLICNVPGHYKAGMAAGLRVR